MQSKSCEMPGWMKIAGINEVMKQRRLLESRLLGEISITSDIQRRTKEPLDESERGE